MRLRVPLHTYTARGAKRFLHELNPVCSNVANRVRCLRSVAWTLLTQRFLKKTMQSNTVFYPSRRCVRRLLFFLSFQWFQVPYRNLHIWATGSHFVEKNESSRIDPRGPRWHPWVPTIINLQRIRCLCCILNALLHAWWRKLLYFPDLP